MPSPKPDAAATPPNPRTGAGAARPPARRSFGRSLTRLLPLDLPLLPAGAAARPELRPHRRDRAGRAAGGPPSPRSTTTAPAPGAPLGCRDAVTPFSGDSRESCPETPLLSGWDSRGDPRGMEAVGTHGGGRAGTQPRGMAAARAVLRSDRCGSDPEPDRGAGKGRGSDRRCHRPAPPRRSLRDAARPYGRSSLRRPRAGGTWRPPGEREADGKEQRDGKGKTRKAGGGEEMEKGKVTGKK